MTGRTASRGSYAKTAARRQEILEAAFAVFAERGYENGSLRDIADKVGISQGGILFHFGSKIDLLEAVLDLRDARSRELFTTRIADQEPGLPHLRALVDLVRDNVNEPGMIQLYTLLAAEGTAADHPAHAYFSGRYAWLVEQSHLSLLALRDQGLLRAGVEPGHAARSLVALLDGLQLQWLYRPTEIDMVGDLRTSIQQLISVPL
ncbi:TetR/AcrR family transcriptional regulator [Demequina sp. SYSU T00192]|uniref:TetR/AcrR family transcriptional regulator n=1 Tax=Demequina litoralis TaxID=3051660 RepID=A0ABT8G750_9MICO|nr:TetR/AcrR family transcriptional regulator [Demequina sp. SYSU T00192]MDN4474744.1 TetR/AcrR family transcriptional regulator [Demequina sp. SYSU T00192]